VTQDGVDVTVTLRPAGAALVHGLDHVAGASGDERAFVPVAASAATWQLLVKAALPRARRGDYVITVDIAPADGRGRALAAAHGLCLEAWDDAGLGAAAAFQRAEAEYASGAAGALAAGDPALAAESFYQCARVHDSLGDQLGAIERQRRALDGF